MDRREQKRRRIMSAAEALFADRRYHEIKMEDIAERAGVGKGTLYRYFADKDDLFQQSAIAGYDALFSAVASERVSGDFREYLRRVCFRLAEFFRRRRRLWQMMQAEERRGSCARGSMRDTWREQRQRLVQALGGVLSHGVSAGVIRADISAETLAVFLLGMLRTEGRENERNPGSAASLECVLELFLNGCTAAGVGSGAATAIVPGIEGECNGEI